MARNEQLTFVIRAKNLFAKTFDNARKRMRELSAGAIRMGKRIAVGMAAAGAAVLALGRSFLRAWEIQARAEAKVAAVIKATGYASGFTLGQLKKQAAQLQRMTGIGDEVILNTQAILATFKEIKGDQFRDATRAILDLGNVMAATGESSASLEAATIMIGKALNDPVKGVTALSRAGMQLNRQQENQVKVFAASGQIVKAQTVILDALKKQFGDTTTEGNATVRAMDILKGTFGDLKEQIGGAIANSDKFQGWLESLQATIDELSESGQLELWAEDVVFAIDNIASSAKYATGWIVAMGKGFVYIGATATRALEKDKQQAIAEVGAILEGKPKPEKRSTSADALDEVHRQWEEAMDRQTVRRQNFRQKRAQKEKAQEEKEAQEMAKAQRLAAKLEAGAVIDGMEDAMRAIESARSGMGREFAVFPEMDEGQIKTALADIVAEHAISELRILKMLDNEKTAYERAAEAAETYLAAVAEQPEGADPTTARGYGVMRFYVKAAESIKKEREELQKSVKPMIEKRKEAERILAALDDMQAERAIKIKLDADATALDAKIAGLEKEISGLLFLDQTDPREERAALFERKENAKRIAEETAKDEARFAELQERQRMGRHITKRSREWMGQFQEGRNRMGEAAAKQGQLDALQRQTAQNTKDSADALKTIKTNLDTLLRAS